MIAELRDGVRRVVVDGRWIVVAVHVAILGGFLLLTVTDAGPSGRAWLMVPVGLAILALELRLALGVARGRRPRGALATLFALAALVYLPTPSLLGWAWTPLQVGLTASVPAVLRGRAAFGLTVALLVLGPAVGVPFDFPGYTPGQLVLWTLYQVFAMAAMTAALYGSARLVAVRHELRRTRVELAETAVARERLRVSRDLHDLLGQSLSAISLKGDLAVRLLTRDPTAARAEVEDLAGAARDALRGVRAITRDEHVVSLRGELDGARELLRAAHVEADVGVDLPALPPHVEHTLAWAVREGVTNVLRHSRATTCTIDASSRDGVVRLSIVNDGADSVRPRGGGLTGLAERVRARSGRFAAGPTGRGRFELAVELPREAP
jgi:two-component system, NarL family, sensor histidine kinase DesK